MRCTRCDRPVCPDCMRSASVGFQCPDCVKQGNVGIRQAKAAYGGTARENPEVTWVLLGLNVVMFLVTLGSAASVGLGSDVSALFERLALTPSVHCSDYDVSGVCTAVADGVAQGQYYRLLTAMFLHFGVIHLALNMYCLFLIGPALERALGRLRFTALYLLSGLSGSALSYALGPDNQMAAGASGAVFGLFAAFYVLQRRRGEDASQILVTIGLNLVLSFALSFIDWRGHVGGLIGGGLVAAALVYAPTGAQRTVVQAAGACGVALLVVVVVAARTLQLTA